MCMFLLVGDCPKPSCRVLENATGFPLLLMCPTLLSNTFPHGSRFVVQSICYPPIQTHADPWWVSVTTK